MQNLADFLARSNGVKFYFIGDEDFQIQAETSIFHFKVILTFIFKYSTFMRGLMCFGSDQSTGIINVWGKYWREKFIFFFSDDATLIMVNLFIRSFAKIDDVKMEYSVQITFRWFSWSHPGFYVWLKLSRQKWSDDRLTYSHKLGKADMKGMHYLVHTSTTWAHNWIRQKKTIS